MNNQPAGNPQEELRRLKIEKLRRLEAKKQQPPQEEKRQVPTLNEFAQQMQNRGPARAQNLGDLGKFGLAAGTSILNTPSELMNLLGIPAPTIPYMDESGPTERGKWLPGMLPAVGLTNLAARNLPGIAKAAAKAVPAAAKGASRLADLVRPAKFAKELVETKIPGKAAQVAEQGKQAFQNTFKEFNGSPFEGGKFKYKDLSTDLQKYIHENVGKNEFVDKVFETPTAENFHWLKSHVGDVISKLKRGADTLQSVNEGFRYKKLYKELEGLIYKGLGEKGTRAYKEAVQFHKEAVKPWEETAHAVNLPKDKIKPEAVSSRLERQAVKGKPDYPEVGKEPYKSRLPKEAAEDLETLQKRTRNRDIARNISGINPLSRFMKRIGY
jgi:hypothetical protein